MEVEVTHFVDAGERDAEGLYDYEGDTYTFHEDSERLVLRTYSDDLKSAFFVGMTCDQVTASALADEVVRYLKSRGRTDFLCLGSRGTYEVWTSES